MAEKDDNQISKNLDRLKEKKYKERLDELELIRNKRQSRPKKPAPIGKKLPKLKKQRFNANEVRAGVLISFFVVVILIMLYLVAPVSKVNSISIKGNQQLSKTNVEKAVGIHTGDSIVKVWQSIAQDEMAAKKNEQQIKNIKISITGPQSVKISIVENKIVGILKSKNKYYPILADGEIKRVNQKQTAYSKVVYEGFKSGTILKQTVAQINQLPKSISQNISEVHFTQTTDSPKQVKLILSDGNTVLIKYDKISKKMAYYPAIAAQMTTNGVVDLEVGAFSYAYGSN